jgi:hypothetical protein
MTFSPFVPVTSHPDDVPTSPIDQPARCRATAEDIASPLWEKGITGGTFIP